MLDGRVFDHNSSRRFPCHSDRSRFVGYKYYLSQGRRPKFVSVALRGEHVRSTNRRMSTTVYMPEQARLETDFTTVIVHINWIEIDSWRNVYIHYLCETATLALHQLLRPGSDVLVPVERVFLPSVRLRVRGLRWCFCLWLVPCILFYEDELPFDFDHTS